MKRTNYYILVASVMLTIGCSGQKGSETNDTTIVAEEAKTTAFVPSDKGVEPIVLGMDIKDIPASVDGLYNSVSAYKDWKEFVEYYIYTFTSNGDTVMDAWAYDANYDKVFNVASINIYPKANVKMQIPEGENHLNFYDSSLEPERPE